MPGDFEPEQKRYLEGLMTGLQIAKTLRPANGNGTLPSSAANGTTGPTEAIGPDAAALRAQDRTIKAGGKLSDPEKFKRELHPFDAYERLKEQAAKNEAPKADDNFRWRFFGLFYCAPTQKSYMCRLRIPNGILKHWQFAGVADLAERYAGGYAHVTTRANLQMREVEPKNAVAMVEAIQDLGLCSRGSGADNIRNVTGTPTAGIDPQELIDTRAYAREWHFHILNDRSLYGIPRKFNVGFDGGGLIPVLEDTNDIGFQAVAVKDGYGIEPGVWFRLMLGGVTGHRTFAGDTGVIVKPAEATAVADGVVRVFIDHGDRTNRAKARLKYVLDAWGFEKFVAALEERLGRKLVRVPAEAVTPRPVFDRFAHIGVHRQKQDGYCWIGIVLPVGKLTAEQMRDRMIESGELNAECFNEALNLLKSQEFWAFGGAGIAVWARKPRFWMASTNFEIAEPVKIAFDSTNRATIERQTAPPLAEDRCDNERIVVLDDHSDGSNCKCNTQDPYWWNRQG